MIKIKLKKNLKENLLLEMPHLMLSDLPEEFVDNLPEEIKSIVIDTEVLDFAFERYPKIDSLKGKLTKYPKKFYVILNDKKFLVDDTGDTIIKKVPFDEEENDIVTLPDNWYEAFLERIK